jgi:hypothetical protein
VVHWLLAAIEERDDRVPVFLPWIRTMPGWDQVATAMNLGRG